MKNTKNSKQILRSLIPGIILIIYFFASAAIRLLVQLGFLSRAFLFDWRSTVENLIAPLVIPGLVIWQVVELVLLLRRTSKDPSSSPNSIAHQSNVIHDADLKNTRQIYSDTARLDLPAAKASVLRAAISIFLLLPLPLYYLCAPIFLINQNIHTGSVIALSIALLSTLASILLSSINVIILLRHHCLLIPGILQLSFFALMALLSASLSFTAVGSSSAPLLIIFIFLLPATMIVSAVSNSLIVHACRLRIKQIHADSKNQTTAKK